MLSHLVVEESARGQGLGDTLLEAFVDAAVDAGRRRAVLVTEPGSRGAGEFYRERGWRHLESQRTREGRRLEVHERDLTGTGPG